MASRIESWLGALSRAGDEKASIKGQRRLTDKEHSRRKDKSNSMVLSRPRDEIATKHDRKGKDVKLAARRLCTFQYPRWEDAEVVLPHSDGWMGVVVPSCGGKTTLALRHGWVDIDSLIDGRRRSHLWGGVLIELDRGESWEVATEPLVQAYAATLRLMEVDKSTIIMGHDVSILRRLEVGVVGGVVINEPMLQHFTHGRDSVEKVMASVNNTVAMGQIQSFNGIQVTTHKEVEAYIVRLCGILSIPCGIPLAYGDDKPGYFGEEMEYGFDTQYELSDLIKAELAGLIPRECVDYHVYKQGRGTYKGYGFTNNDWAKLFAKANKRISSDPPEWKEWTDGRVIDFERLSEDNGLAQEADVQYIIDAHKGEDTRFVLNLIVFWKALGVQSSLKTRLLRWMQVPRRQWSAFFTLLGRNVQSSVDMLGYKFTEEERLLISDIHMLASFHKQSMIRLLGKANVPRGVSSPPATTVAMIKRGLRQGTVSDFQVDPKDILLCKESLSGTALKYFSDVAGPISDLGEPVSASKLVAAMRDNGVALKFVIGTLVAIKISKEWVHDPGWEHKLSVAVSGVCTALAGIGLQHDEWISLIDGLLISDDYPTCLPLLASEWLMCRVGRALTGDTWGTRLYTMMKQTVVWGYVAADCGKRIACRKKHDDTSEIYVEAWDGYRCQTTLIESVFPYHMLEGCSDDEARAVDIWSRIRRNEKSQTMRVMEILNADYWYTELKKGDMKLALVCHWFENPVGIDKVVYNSLLNIHFKFATGHTADTGRLLALSNFVHTRRSDGGMGIPDKHNTVLKTTEGKYARGKLCSWNVRSLPVRPHKVEVLPTSYDQFKVERIDFECGESSRNDRDWQLHKEMLAHAGVFKSMILELACKTAGVEGVTVHSMSYNMRVALSTEEKLDDAMEQLDTQLGLGRRDRNRRKYRARGRESDSM